ncbi:YesL family protein [Microbacterium sp. RU33B]|uniref:YesL family protein n=1 Tax=Microbacterium sp. RU33B TaxID=1907390 RepID=UPI0009693B31|nr:YesL family protein [Microbacterium sp. RU33B]SIT66620.1 Uncharacterized membrane protein YesL [Microbacterium sp. RU33B]
MRIDPDSRALGGFTVFLTFVALNALYLLCCVPLLTIGAATSALFTVTIRYSDDESGRPLKDFFPAMRADFGRATALFLLLALPATALVASSVFWFSHDAVFAGALGLLAVLGALYLFVAFVFAMAQTAWLQASVSRTLKNSLLLPAAEPLRSMGLLVIPVSVVAIAILFPPFLILVATIGFSVGAYVSAFIFRSVFARRAT